MYDRGLWRYIRFFENPVDFINSPVYRDGCEFSGIFPENPVGLAGMYFLIFPVFGKNRIHSKGRYCFVWPM